MPFMLGYLRTAVFGCWLSWIGVLWSVLLSHIKTLLESSWKCHSWCCLLQQKPLGQPQKCHASAKRHQGGIPIFPCLVASYLLSPCLTLRGNAERGAVCWHSWVMRWHRILSSSCLSWPLMDGKSVRQEGTWPIRTYLTHEPRNRKEPFIYYLTFYFVSLLFLK